jgi:hypothetical protein
LYKIKNGRWVEIVIVRINKRISYILIFCVILINFSTVFSSDIQAQTYSEATGEEKVEMWAGDIGEARDGAINMADIMGVWKAFNTSYEDSNFIGSADINGDSAINIADIFLIAQHFNRTSADCPISWKFELILMHLR